MAEDKPKGINILGGINLYLFGIFFTLFLSGFLFYFKFVPNGWDNFLKIINEVYPGLTFSYKQFVWGILVELLRSVAFIVSGIGLIKVKEWGKILTLIIAFISAVLIFVSVVMNSAFIQQGVIQIIYPAILIIYFTNKNVANYFKEKK